MFWDGVIFVFLVVMVGSGWSSGIIASWRSPIALMLATIGTKYVYIDMAAWFMEKLRCDAAAAVFCSYLMFWAFLYLVVEIILATTLKAGSKGGKPGIVDKIFGSMYGLLKGTIIIVLPLMALSVPIHIPPPPPEQSGIEIPDMFSDKGSALVPGFRGIAKSMKFTVGGVVINENPPAKAPKYEDVEVPMPDVKAPKFDIPDTSNSEHDKTLNKMLDEE